MGRLKKIFSIYGSFWLAALAWAYPSNAAANVCINDPIEVERIISQTTNNCSLFYSKNKENVEIEIEQGQYCTTDLSIEGPLSNHKLESVKSQLDNKYCVEKGEKKLLVKSNANFGLPGFNVNAIEGWSISVDQAGERRTKITVFDKGFVPSSKKTKGVFPLSIGKLEEEKSFPISNLLETFYEDGYLFSVNSALANIENPTSQASLKITRSDGVPMAGFNLSVIDKFERKETIPISLASDTVYNDRINSDNIRLELATTRKLIADEAFIQMGTLNLEEEYKIELKNKAIKYYNEALLTVSSAGKDETSTLTTSELATLELIRSDVAYRKLLLETGTSFWGGFRTLKPTTPYHEWLKLKILMDEFEATRKEQDQLEIIRTDAQGNAIIAQAKKAEVIGRIRGLQFSDKANSIDLNRYDRQIGSYESRLNAIQEEITAKIDQMDRLADAQENLSAAAASQMTSLIASSSGLPLEEIRKIENGDISRVITSVVSSQLADSNSQLFHHIADHSSEFEILIKTGRELKETYETAERLVEEAEFIIDTIREPNWENVIKSGEIIYARVPETEKIKIDAKVEEIIEETKPALAWVQSAYNYAKKGETQLLAWEASINRIGSDLDLGIDEVRKILIQEIETIYNSELEDKTRLIHAKLDKLFRRISRDINTKNDKDLEKLFVLTLIFYPDLVADLDQETRSSIRKRFPNAASHLQQAKVLVENTNAFKIKKGQLQIIDHNGEVLLVSSHPNIYEEIRKISLGRYKILEREKGLVIQAIDRLLDVEIPKINILSSFLDPGRVNSLVQKEIGKLISENKRTRIRRIWKKLEKSEELHPEIHTQTNNDMRSMIIASLSEPLIAAEQPAVQPRENINEYSLPGDTGLDPETEALAMAALNYAFPGAGVALGLAQTWAAMDANRNLNQNLSNETMELVIEYNRLLSSTDKAYFDSAIGSVEAQRLNALSHAANVQREAYLAAIDHRLSASNKAEAKLRLYRPYYFYLAEKLREQFDLFDRSLAMWNGEEDGRGLLFQKIRENPQNVRLALESEIHLFDWLNRDRESTKTDPFYLYLHWKKLVLLASQFCQLEGECRPGENSLGDVAPTSRLSLLEDLLSKVDRDRFQDWKKSDSQEPFSARFFVNPRHLEHDIDLSDKYNLRIIDVNATAEDRGENFLPYNFIELEHTGSSLIPLINETSSTIYYRQENLLPARSTIQSDESGINMSSVSARFSGLEQGNLSPLFPFEGYGLMGEYEITIRRSPNTKSIKDIKLQFAFFSKSRSVAYNERDYYEGLVSQFEPPSISSYLSQENRQIVDTSIPAMEAELSFSSNFNCSTQHPTFNIDENANHFSKLNKMRLADGLSKENSRHEIFRNTYFGCLVPNVTYHCRSSGEIAADIREGSGESSLISSSVVDDYYFAKNIGDEVENKMKERGLCSGIRDSL